MFRETIGSTPYGENCAQVGAKNYNYTAMARLECKALIGQISRLIPDAKDYLKIVSFPHDFGYYMEVCFCCNDNDDTAQDIFYEVDNLDIEQWDSEAKEYLKANKYFIGSN